VLLFLLAEVQDSVEVGKADIQGVEVGGERKHGVRGGEPPGLVEVVAWLGLAELPDGRLGGADERVLGLEQGPERDPCRTRDKRRQGDDRSRDRVKRVQDLLRDALVLNQLADAVEASAGDAVAFPHRLLPLIR